MFHSKIEARPTPAADVHSYFCGCPRCFEARDPIAYRARRRSLVAWAVLFTVLVVGFYGYAAANAAEIATAFGAGR